MRDLKIHGGATEAAEPEEPSRVRSTAVVQRRAGGGGGGPPVGALLGGGDGGGDGGGGGSRQLPGPVRASMEDAFDFDFGGVRVHEGNEARAVGARAFAQGSDLHFAPGAYDPSSAGGLELIGHELAHVVQQREGRVPVTTQFKGEHDGNDDAGLEHEADRWGARAARGEPVGRSGGSGGSGGGGDGALVQRKVIQREGPPAGVVAARRTFSVPPVVDIGRIADPTARNHAINQSYHVIDAAMTGYLGDPLVANWFTFGQHASREAGTQIRNLQNGLQVLRDLLPALQALSGGPLLALFGQAGIVVTQLRRMMDLASQDLLFQQSLQLAFAQAGITQAEINALILEAEIALAVAPVAGLMLPGALLVFIPFMGRLMNLAGRLIAAIPAIITSVERVFQNMVRGNREIYENVAPAAHAFLAAAQGAPDGVPAGVAFVGDASGFLAAAFAEYGECRKLGDEARAAPGTPEAAQKLAERQRKAHHANLVIGFQEQLVILQPIFDTMQTELRAMSGTMVLHDPNGAHPLANNWGDFYTRMGIDPATAPADPRTIRAGSLPPLLPATDPRRRGTIAEYFESGLTNEKVHEAPPAIAPVP